MSALRRLLFSVPDLLVLERGRILLFVSLLLVGAVSFQAGFLKGSSISEGPIVIERPVAPSCPEEVGTDPATGASKTGTASALPDPGACAFVGSRNSDLYHLPTCGTAKRIKPENIVCFSSKEDAESKGYEAGCVE
jgi:hypothetical protein